MTYQKDYVYYINMGKKKIEKLGRIKTNPRDLTKDQGHAYGAGRSTEAHKDARKKRKRTRRAKLKEAMKGW